MVGQVAQVVQDQALQRTVVQFLGQGVGAIQMVECLTGMPFRSELRRGRQKQSRFAMLVAGSVGQHQALVERLACLSHLTEHIQRAAGDPVGLRLLACVQARQRAHQCRQIGADPDRAAQSQCRPGADDRADRRWRIRERHRAPARHDQGAGLHAAIGHRGALVEPAEVAPVAQLRCGDRGLTTPRIAPVSAQMLRRVPAHALQQIEALVGDLAHEALVDEPEHDVDRPRRVGGRGQVEHRLGRIKCETALVNGRPGALIVPIARW